MSARGRLVLDLTLFAGFLIAFYPETTGLAIHEWLSLAVVSSVLAHVVINWDWTTRAARKLFVRLRAASRVNFVVDTALFLSAVTVSVSGVMVSRVVAGTLGLSMAPDLIWYSVHSISAWLTIGGLLVHFALHMKWAAGVVRKMVLRPQADGPSRKAR